MQKVFEMFFSTSVESSSPECMYVCLSHFFASVGAHSRLASLSKIWVCGFLWYFRKISGVVFFIFSKFSFFGLFGGLKNLKNGQKIFFGNFFLTHNREVVQITACFWVQLICNCTGSNIPLNTCNLYCGVDLTSQNTLANNGKMSWPRLRTDVRDWWYGKQLVSTTLNSLFLTYLTPD